MATAHPGFTDRILKVNLSNGRIEIQSRGENFYRTYFGVRVLIAYELLTSTEAVVDPLGPDNLLAFTAGVSTEAPIGECGPNSIGGRSPLTGCYSGAEVGGYWDTELKKAEHDALIVSGRSDGPVYLSIKDDRVEVQNAGKLRGKKTAEVEDLIIRETGDKSTRICRCGTISTLHPLNMSGGLPTSTFRESRNLEENNMIRYVLIVPVLGLLVLFLSYASSGRKAQIPETLIEVELKDIGVDPNSRAPVLILADREEGRVLPIFIGISEASAISKGLSGDMGKRPMTHDLIVSIIEELGADLTRVVIKNLNENIFFADLVLRYKKKEIKIDCRPSDAIAIAVRFDAPLFISRNVLESSLSEELTEWWHREVTTSRLGLNLQDLTEELARAMNVDRLEGVLVSSVEEEGVADEAGIKKGDIIVSINGEAVREAVEAGLRLSEKSGGKADLLVVRDGEEISLSISVPVIGRGTEDEF